VLGDKVSLRVRVRLGLQLVLGLMTRCSKHISINTIVKLTKFANGDKKLRMFTISYGNIHCTAALVKY